MSTLKTNTVLIIGNLILLLYVIYSEKRNYDYYKNDSSDKDISIYNDFLSKKLKNVDPYIFKNWKNSDLKSVKLQILVLTKFRSGITNNDQYFHLTLQSILKAIYFSSESQIVLSVCNINDNNGDYLKKWKDIDLMVFKRPEWVRNKIIINQETLHYLWCLKQMMKLNSTTENFLIFEDDVELEINRFFPVLNKFIRKLNNKKDFALKLYHPLRILGFLQPEFSRILELIALAIIFYYFIKLIAFIFSYRSYRSTSVKFSLSIFIFCVNMTILISRQRFLYLRTFHKDLHLLVPAPFCCTPGMLFSKSLMQKLVGELNFEKYIKLFETDFRELPIDKLIYDFIMDNSIPYYYIEPNIITHFGRISTIRDAVDPRAL